MELGNLLFGHCRGRYLINREKYQERFVKFLESLGCDSYGFCTDESKRDEYDCASIRDFVVRPYYWGDDESRFNLPNFECSRLNIQISWYKYPLRDSYCNKRNFKRVMKELERLRDEFKS